MGLSLYTKLYIITGYRGTKQHDVFLAFQESQLGQTVDLFPFDRGLKGEIELLQPLGRR
jgi:hypothetical protein